MRKLLILLALPFFTSCELDYEGAERVEFKGKIVDEQGNPLDGVYVIAAAEKDNWHDYDEISYDFTDENGNFSMFFPSPTNEDEMQLFVNYGTGDIYEIPNRSRVKYYNIQDQNLVDYRLDFGTIEVFGFNETAVTLSIHAGENYQYQLLGWNLNGKIVDNYVNLSPLTYSEDVFFYSPNQVWVQPGQTIEMTYYYRNYAGGGIQQNTVQIEVQNQNLSYEIVL